jgi:hypothetical protein
MEAGRGEAGELMTWGGAKLGRVEQVETWPAVSWNG